MVLAFALAPNSTSDPQEPKAHATAVVSVSATPPASSAVEPCAQVLSRLPVDLDGYHPRITVPVPPSSAAPVSWGDPPIVLLCGVGRPKELTEGSSALIIGVGAPNPVDWLPVTGDNATVFTVIDREVYLQVTVPKVYTQPPLATLSTAIADALPAVCQVAGDGSAAPSPSASGSSPGAASLPLCTRRS